MLLTGGQVSAKVNVVYRTERSESNFKVRFINKSLYEVNRRGNLATEAVKSRDPRFRGDDGS